LLFWILLEVLLALNFWYEYRQKQLSLQERIQMEMKLCAYSVQCQGLHTDFVERGKNREENLLYRDGDFYSYFTVPTVKKYLMKVVYPEAKYNQQLEALEYQLKQQFLIYSLLSALVSFLFAIYALMPLRKALRLNEEFVKDILHDFNTPLSSMRINLKLFKKEVGESEKIGRMENNIETILSLQHNLKAFLQGAQTQVERFNVAPVIEDRIGYFRVLYPDITFHLALHPTQIEVNKDAFVRVVDNLLSNAGKYNKANGEVRVSLERDLLTIADTGKGIASPNKVFQRYYKEQDRGIGIGLHIVKKLCDEMRIGIEIKSRVGRGTTIVLKLAKVVR